MKFQRILNPRGRWPISATIGQGDDATVVTFWAVFEWIPPAEALALDPSKADVAGGGDIFGLMRRCLVGVASTEDPGTVEEDPAVLQDLIQNPWYLVPLHLALGDFLRGRFVPPRSAVPADVVEPDAAGTIPVAEAAAGN